LLLFRAVKSRGTPNRYTIFLIITNAKRNLLFISAQKLIAD